MPVLVGTSLVPTSSVVTTTPSSSPIPIQDTGRITVRVILAAVFCLICFALITSLFLCAHRIRGRDGRGLRTSVFLRIELWWSHGAAASSDTVNSSRPPHAQMRTNTCPLQPSRRSTFDQELPPYEPGGYVPHSNSDEPRDSLT